MLHSKIFRSPVSHSTGEVWQRGGGVGGEDIRDYSLKIVHFGKLLPHRAVGRQSTPSLSVRADVGGGDLLGGMQAGPG